MTLRISGLFRDAFAEQIALFDQAVSAVAERREPDAWNPLAAQVRGLEGAARKRASARIFGAAAGAYGTGVEEHLLHGTWATQADLGAAWLEGSSWMYGGGREGTRDEAALSTLLGRAETVLHVQDSAETDLLESPDIAAHEGGLAAASHMAGGAPSVLHGDTSRPQSPRLRATADEVARIVRGRLANPQWIEGMQRHGYAGAAELARGWTPCMVLQPPCPSVLTGSLTLCSQRHWATQRAMHFCAMPAPPRGRPCASALPRPCSAACGTRVATVLPMCSMGMNKT